MKTGTNSGETMLERVERRAGAFVEVGKRLNSCRSALEAAHVVVEVADKLLGWDACTVDLFAPGAEDRLEPVLYMDTIDGARRLVTSPIAGQTATTMTRQTLAEGPRLILRQPGSDEELSLTRFGDTSRPSASLIFVPIISLSGVIGAISIQSYMVNAYTEIDVEELQALAEYCSGALERTLAEARLQESEERHREMFLRNTAIQILLDPETGIVTDANAAACQFYGYPMDRLCGKDMRTLILSPGLADPIHELQRVAIGSRYAKLQHRVSSGKIRHVEVNATLIVVQGRDVIHLIVHDISERKIAEERSAAFSELGRKLSEVTQPVQAADVIVEMADRLIGWDACFLVLLAADIEQKFFCENQVLPLVHYDLVGGEKRKVGFATKYIQPGTYSHRAIMEGPQLILRTPGAIATESSFPFGDEHRVSGSLLFVPIQSSAQTIGVLSIQSYRANAYTQQDLETLCYLAEHCSGALERTRAEEQARLFSAAIHLSNDMVVITASDGDYVSDSVIVFVNEAFEKASGFLRHEMVGQKISCLWGEKTDADVLERMHASLRELRPTTVELYKYRKDKTQYPAEISAFPITGSEGRLQHFVFVHRDISQRKAAEQHLAYQALHDPLTDLANRALFMERLERVMARAKRQGDKFAVLFLDLDSFKTINDTYGHHVGDQLLIAIARRLETCLRPVDTAARIGGDEFVILLEDITCVSDATLVADRIVESLRTSFVLGQLSLKCSASIGLAMHSQEMDSVSQVMRCADEALYRAKAGGKGQYSLSN